MKYYKNKKKKKNKNICDNAVVTDTAIQDENSIESTEEAAAEIVSHEFNENIETQEITEQSSDNDADLDFDFEEKEYYDVVSVRFKDFGKVYYFDPCGFPLKTGDNVIVRTVKGCEFATVTSNITKQSASKITAPLRPVIRIATQEDIEIMKEHQELEKTYLKICAEEIKRANLDMQLVSCECSFDGSKVMFYFTSDGRVDFRDLVKRLASIMKTRIELRQVGVRDKAKLVGGIGPCGRVICCASHLSSFVPVSVKMAKEQGIALSPTKISGICGRLMCCLKYEQDLYEELRSTLPTAGCEVEVPDGKGVISETNVLTERCKVKVFQNDGSYEIKEYPVDDITVTKYRHQKKQQKTELEMLESSIPED